MGTKAIKGKATPREVVHQAQIDDRVRRAMPPRVDPTGACHAAVAELARDHGLDPADLLEEAVERASVRQYLGGVTQAEAERLAVEDVRESVRRRVA
jgi:hypothetical protein